MFNSDKTWPSSVALLWSKLFINCAQVISEPVKSMAEILVDVCAYAGTGNVLKIQKLLHICSEHYEEKDEVSRGVKLILYSLFVYKVSVVAPHQVAR